MASAMAKTDTPRAQPRLRAAPSFQPRRDRRLIIGKNEQQHRHTHVSQFQRRGTSRTDRTSAHAISSGMFFASPHEADFCRRRCHGLFEFRAVRIAAADHDDYLHTVRG